MHTSKEFVLHGGDKAFVNRQKLLFDQLSVAEKEYNKNKTNRDDTSQYHTSNRKMEVEVDREPQSRPRGIKRKSETERFRGRESIFKRPEGPAPRAVIRSIPDYHRNPHKWVKYSLEDVSNEDMSDKSNTQAAFSFLRELKTRNANKKSHDLKDKMDIDESEGNEEKSKVKFRSNKVSSSSHVEYRKPDTEKDKCEKSCIVIEHDEKPIFRSSKIIMPEYVVGQKQKKKEKKNKQMVKIERSKELKLDHLLEIDDAEN